MQHQGNRERPEDVAAKPASPPDHRRGDGHVQAVVEGVAILGPDGPEAGEHGPVQDLADQRVHLVDEPLNGRTLLEVFLEPAVLEATSTSEVASTVPPNPPLDPVDSGWGFGRRVAGAAIVRVLGPLLMRWLPPASMLVGAGRPVSPAVPHPCQEPAGNTARPLARTFGWSSGDGLDGETSVSRPSALQTRRIVDGKNAHGAQAGPVE